MNTLSKLIKSQKGSSIVIVAFTMAIIASVCALVFDIGVVFLEKSRFQMAIDSTALACAQDLPDTQKAYDTANTYIQNNGYTSSDIVVTFRNNNKVVEIKGNKTVKYTFAKVLGLNQITISPKAAAGIGLASGAFDYALFSGSTTSPLTINGANTRVEGNSHTNSDFISHGSGVVITGACEAVKTLTITGNGPGIPNRFPYSQFVEMPDFTETIKEQSQSCNQVYSSSKVYNGNIDVSDGIYVNGEISVNSSKFSGSSCILAKSSIVFNGSSLYKASGDAICFYSETGNIIINGANSEIHGILYAPKGTIIFNGNKQKVYGRVIANNVILNGGTQIIGDNVDLSTVPVVGGYKLIE